MSKKRQHQLKGKEIFEITPVILGGSPTDPKNKTVLSRAEHIEAVNFWNKIISRLKFRCSSQTERGKPLGIRPNFEQ